MSEKKTIADHVIGLFVYLLLAYTVVSIPLGVMNFITIMFTYLAVRSIQLPLYVLILVAVFTIAAFIVFGYFIRVYNIQGRITSVFNRFMNPEFSDVWKTTMENQKKMDAICKKLGITEDDLK